MGRVDWPDAPRCTDWAPRVRDLQTNTEGFFFISLVCVSSTTTFQVNKTQSCGIPIPLSSLYSTQKLSTRWRYITLLFPFCYDVLWMYNELSTLSWLNMPDITICHGPGRAGFISLLFPLLYSQCYSYSGCKFLSVERLELIPWGETKTQIPTCKILKFKTPPQTHWRLFCLLSPQPPHINIQCHAPLSGSVTDFNVVRPHFLN